MLRYAPIQHMRQKLQETQYFLDGVCQFAEAIDQLAASGQSVFTQNGYPLVRRLQYNLSAMLSAFQCVLNYMKNDCTSTAALKWYKKVKRRKLIEAFGALRHSDVHDETFGTTHQTTIVPGVSRRSNMMLNAEALAAAKGLCDRPKIVKVLTSRPLVDLATEACHDLAQALEDGYSRRQFASLPALAEPTKLVQLSETPPRTLAEYLSSGSMNEFAYKALCDAVARRRAIQLGGNTGSGKTSLLRALIREYHAVSGDGFRAILLGSDSEELRRSFPELQINGIDDEVVGGLESFDAVFVDNAADRAMDGALRSWRDGVGGAFTVPHGDLTPRMMELNAVAPVSVVMVEGAVGMLFARHDDKPADDDDLLSSNSPPLNAAGQ